jgi:hypothetical protein
MGKMTEHGGFPSLWDIPDISGHVGTIPHIYIWNGGFHKWGNIPIAGWFTMENPI